MKKLLSLLVLLIIFDLTDAQKYYTKNGIINFISETPLEKISAINNQVYSVLDISTGEFIFKVLINGFEFEKQIMQEHFNAKYAESDKYPEATFKGSVKNLINIDFTKDGSYPAMIEGDLTIHGVTKKVKEVGIFEVKNGLISGQSILHIILKEYNIGVPDDKIYNVAPCIKINVDVVLKK